MLFERTSEFVREHHVPRMAFWAVTKGRVIMPTVKRPLCKTTGMMDLGTTNEQERQVVRSSTVSQQTSRHAVELTDPV